MNFYTSLSASPLKIHPHRPSSPNSCSLQGITIGKAGQYLQVYLMVVRTQLSRIVQFSVLMLSCNNLNYQKQVNFHTIQVILKRLLLQADFFFLLIIYCKLLPLLVWAQSKTPFQVDKELGASFRQMVRPLARTHSTKQIRNQQMQKIMNEQLQLLQDLNNKNFFLFFFELINAKNQEGENNIDFYFLQLENIEQQRLISSSQLSIIKHNFYLQHGKLKKRKYQQEAINYLYKWLQKQLQLMFYQTQNASYFCIDTFNHIVRSHSNICGATLLQVIDANVQSIAPTKIHYLLQLIDTCLIQATYKISTQAILFVICTIFNKIHLKKIQIEFGLIIEHLLLWKFVAAKRKLPHKLLTCLIQWIPLLYDNAPQIIPNEPQSLQLYRKQFLMLENEDDTSEITGLIVVVEQLQIRKIQAIYQQMEEFHQQMDNSRPIVRLSKSIKSSKANFSYNISKINKSSSQINSLLNDLQSRLSMVQAHSKHLQLQLLSKPHSMSGYGSMSLNTSRSLGQFVEIIMSLIDLFDYSVQSASRLTEESQDQTTNKRVSFTQTEENYSNALPIVSQLEHLPSNKQKQSQKSNKKQELPSKNVKINYCIKDEDSKKRMAKNRGLVTKTQIYQIGYLFEGGKSKLSLFIIFFKPIKFFALKLKQKSLKLKEAKKCKLLQPKVDKQYKLQYFVERIKLYQLQGIKNSEKLVKNKIQVTIQQSKDNIQEIYDIPITIFNLIQWYQVQAQDLKYFEGQPLFQTQWLPACTKFVNYGGVYLKNFLLFRQEQKGNYLIKAKLLEQMIFAKIITVLNNVKIQMMNSKCLLLCMGLVEVIV